MAMNLTFVELIEHVAREVLDAEAEHAESGATQRNQALGRHGIDPIGADELKFARQRAALFGTHDGIAQRQHATILGEYENVVLEDDRADLRMRRDDPMDHVQTFLGIESCDAGHAALRFMQKVGR